MQRQYTIKIYTIYKNQFPKMSFVQHDTEDNKISFELYDDINVPMTDIIEATATVSRPDNKTFTYGMDSFVIADNVVTFILPPSAVYLDGKYSASISVYDSNMGRLTTETFTYSVTAELVSDTPVDETNEYPVLTKLIDDVNTATNGFKASGATGVDAEVILARDGETDLITKINKMDSATSDNTSEIVAARKNEVDLPTKIGKIDDSISFHDLQLNDVIQASIYGFKADYQGTPQYDGQDGTRITCTDNTQAFSDMLDDCIAKKFLAVHFAKGHYGITTGNIQKDLTGCTLMLYGDGIDVSIIDFVKEDNLHTAYVDETTANYIAKITNANVIVIKDLTLKATTNYNNPNGNQADNNAVYYGAVWGFVLDKFSYLKLDNIKVTQFNYRGISTMNSNRTSWATCNPRIDIINCTGITNKGSGYWIKDTQFVNVDGGEFSYNGQRGVKGTGYGIACSSYIHKVVVKDAYFHHNYRKGFDTHSCLDVTLKSVLFEDNVLFDFYINGWDIYVEDMGVKIQDVTIIKGLTTPSKTWLQDCYNALLANGFTDRSCLFSIADDNGSGTTSRNALKEININNLNILSAYNGGDILTNGTGYAIVVNAPSANLKIKNSNIDLTGFIVNSNSVYSSITIQLIASTWSLDKTHIKWLEDSKYNSTYKGCLLYAPLANRKITVNNCNFDLNNCFLIGQTSSGSLGDAGASSTTERTFKNNNFNWLLLPDNTTSNLYFGNTNSYTRFFDNNIVNVNGIKLTVPNFKTVESTPYILSQKGLSIGTMPLIAAGADLFQIIVDGYINIYTLEIDGFNDYLKVRDNTVITDGTNITFKSQTQFVDTDGRQKTKLVIKTKNQLSAYNYYYVDVKVKGYINSWGIESISKLF